MALAMFSTAMRMAPSAISSGVRPSPTWAASSAKPRARLQRRVAGRCRARRSPGRAGVELAHHDVGIGHGERAAAAVALGPRIGAGALGADAEARAVVGDDRAAAGRDRMHAQHRHGEAHARDLRLERALVVAGEVRDVGRRAAHVEADDAVEARRALPSPPCRRRRPRARTGSRRARGTCRADFSPPDDAMNRSVSCPSLPLAYGERVERARHPIHIPAQDRRQIGVGHRRVAARHELDQRRDLVARRHLAEARSPRASSAACRSCSG